MPLKRLWHPTGQKTYLEVQVIFVIKKLDVETQKPDSEGRNFFVSFVSKNVGDIHQNVHEIVQAGFNNSLITLKNETSPCVRDELGRNKRREVTPAAPLCPS